MSSMDRNHDRLFFEKDSCDPDYLVFMHNTDDVSYISRRHYHKAIELHYMISGRVGCYIDDTMEYIQDGEMAIVDSWDIHFYDIQKNNETITLIIGTGYFKNFYRRYGEGSKIPCFPAFMRNKAVNQRILEIMLRWEKEYCRESVLTNLGYVNLICGELVRGYPLMQREAQKPMLNMLGNMLDYVDRNYRENISLQNVADYLGIGVTYCSKIFHDSMDQDFRTYVNGVRIEEARRLMLAQPDRNIADIALECGFNSLNTFYRAYKNMYSQPPRR